MELTTVQYIQLLEALFHKKSSKLLKVNLFDIKDQYEPGVNWLFYDSEEGFASVFKLKSQQEFIKSRVPEENKQ